MLAILEYGSGNQTSVKRALEYLGIPCAVTANADSLSSFSGIIFPGVGSSGQAMAELKKSGLDIAIKNCAAKKQPLLGICLGCQILLEKSEEDSTDTLNICSGKNVLFPKPLHDENGNLLKVPHMGWNSVKRLKQNRIWQGIPEDAEFYFVHSYFTMPAPELMLATTSYGIEFCSVYGRDGLWAAQFHPEKSGRWGLKFLENFYLYCKEHADAFKTADYLS